ncbi:hypothetical protein C8J98_102234 [Luteibacter sp. OK325]|uniref:hypothetical protein n=1 Tax=Luteibacter sp. OK325 TaxID=2135670 RepID=UPI000D367D97|nr:hypothetical protein [Luteibacter sp. OK325]PTR34046.1 hypothetical protein C8J98_102234 [Luteibacter sp. OK325]
MKVDQCTSHPLFGISLGQRFARDHRTSLSLLVGSEAGEDLVAMVTLERVGPRLEWEALVWRGPIVLTEMSGSCADVPGVVEAQIRNRIAERAVRNFSPLPLPQAPESKR